MERRTLSKPQTLSLSKAQYAAMRERKARLEAAKKRHIAARDAELLAKARVEFKAERATPPPVGPQRIPHRSNAFVFAPQSKGAKHKLGFEIKTPNRLIRALQVCTTTDPEWGTIKAFSINTSTGRVDIEKLDKELRYHRDGWVNTGYFGPDAKFRIDTVSAPGSKRSY